MLTPLFHMIKILNLFGIRLVFYWKLESDSLFLFAGYIWNYRKLPCTWVYRCYFGSWTSWYTRRFDHKSSTFRSHSILWITQCGKYLMSPLVCADLYFIFCFHACFLNLIFSSRLQDMTLRTRKPLEQCQRLTHIWFLTILKPRYSYCFACIF